MEITILATSDVHGYLPQVANGASGLMAIPSIYKDQHADLLIDNGDYLIGSPLSTFYNVNYAVSPLINIANRLGYDVMIPGNHDFDYGLDFLQRQVSAFDGAYVCANALDEQGKPLFKPYHIINRKGVRIGVIGLITGAMPQIESYDAIKDVRFESPLRSMLNWLPIVQQQSDIVIVSYHGGIECDMNTGQPTQYDTGEDQAYRIITEYGKAIDGLICGHQHRLNCGISRTTPFVQPGYRGDYVGRLCYRVQQGTIFKEEGELIDTKTQTESSPTIPNILEYYHWLQTAVDDELVYQYFCKQWEIPNFWVQLVGQDYQGLQQSFTQPYQLHCYHLSGKELKKVAQDRKRPKFCRLPEKIVDLKDYRILTNLSDVFPNYRLEQNFVTNVFDELLREHIQKSS